MDTTFKYNTSGQSVGSLPDCGLGQENGSVRCLAGATLCEQLPIENEAKAARPAAVAESVREVDARLLNRHPDAIVLETYRRLRTKLLRIREERPFRTLVVTSPSPKEGKTLTCINLGLSLAMLNSLRILLVDGDLRRGSLGRYLGIDERAGLSNALEGSAALDDVIFTVPAAAGVNVLLRGTSTFSPAELLNSSSLRTYMRLLGERFDVVLVDSPPVNLLTDVQLITASCDAVLLVARAFSTSRKSLESAMRDLAHSNVIATVLNGGAPLREHKKFRSYYSPEANQ